MYDTAYFGGEEGLREAYVKYAKVALEPKTTITNEELENRFEQLVQQLKALLRTMYDKLLSDALSMKRDYEQKLEALENRLKLIEALSKKT